MSIALTALGWPLSHVAVYNAVQAAGAAVTGLRREATRHGGGQVVALGTDLTGVRCALDRWNLWGRLTRYRTWVGPDGETLDGTNNACERAIGFPLTEVIA